MTVEEFRSLQQEQQNRVLDQNYKDNMKEDLKLSDKTLASRKGKLDSRPVMVARKRDVMSRLISDSSHSSRLCS